MKKMVVFLFLVMLFIVSCSSKQTIRRHKPQSCGSRSPNQGANHQDDWHPLNNLIETPPKPKRKIGFNPEPWRKSARRLFRYRLPLPSLWR